MATNDDWLSGGLPVFSGGKDRSQARGMLDHIGGPGGFKTAYQTNPDGSTTVVQTKGVMPPQVRTERSGATAANTYLRGYIADMQSVNSTALSKVVAAILEKLAGVWRKKKLTSVFGKYVVSPLSSAPAANDVWVLKDGALRIFGKNNVTSRAGIACEGVPLIATTDTLAPYDNGASLFVLSNSGICRAPIQGISVATQVYSADELDVGTEGYLGGGAVAGVSYTHDPLAVSFTRIHISAVGSILQRSRRVALTNSPPYAIKGEYVSNLIQGYVYLAPVGNSSSSTQTGEWLNPVPDGNHAICEVYAKEGSAPYGTLVAKGYLFGEIVDNPSNTATISTWEGSNHLDNSVALGWIGAPITLDYTMSVTASHRRESSSGSRWNEVPFLIADPRAGSTSYPPSYTHQWRSFSDAISSTPAGALLSMVCSGWSTKNTWESQTQSIGSVNGVEMCSITYKSQGMDLSRSGTRFFNRDTFMFDGAGTGITSIKDNPYADEYNAVLKCSTAVPAEYTTTARSESFSDYSREETWTLSCTTRDYILFDQQEKTHVYLLGEFSGGKTSASVSLSIVVEINGVTFTTLIHEYETTESGFLVYTETAHNECSFHPPVVPFTGFAPPFCCQGEFRYGAYSEASESGESVFLMSLPLSIKMRDDWPDPPVGAFLFDPTMFKGVFGSYGGLGVSLGFWSDFSATVTHVNFADGVFTNWVSGVFAEAQTDEDIFAEVYRT